MNQPVDEDVLEKDKSTSVDDSRRNFLIHASCTLTGIATVCALRPLFNSWLPSARALASAGAVKVDISRLEPGQQVTVEWRGKPVWIIRRTTEMLAQLKNLRDGLRDPDSNTDQQPDYARNIYRSIRPDYLVLVGVCTHLGCTPRYQPHHLALSENVQAGFYCPCHGSRFDLSGRVYKGVPAPINLEVPPYHFKGDHEIIIGED